jgi:ribosomal protein S18 acetylase RimI-like enzyme
MIAAAARHRAEGLTPFDPFRHIKPVAELIAQSFAGELGPQARIVLRRMRRMARWGGLGLWLWGVQSTAIGTSGFVWIEKGEVVGNVSVRRSASSGGWMIGNVAVRPDWRGQGIGRALTEAAVSTARERGASWVGLEVREDNDVARGLYERMGFTPVGSLLELARPEGKSWPSIAPPPVSLRRARAGESKTLYRLAQAGLDRSHRKVLELRRSAYRAGWDVRLAALLEGCRENWWVVEEGGRVVGAVHITSRWPMGWHSVEVLVEQDHLGDLGPRLAEAGLATLSQRRPWESTTSLPGPREVLEPIFSDVGFQRVRRLLQMRLILGRQVEIS